jgi:hypothetical protein
VTVVLVYAPRNRRLLFQVGAITLVVLALAVATIARTAVLA